VGHLTLLRRNPAFRLLFLATFGSGLGTMLAFLALTIDVWDRTHSGTWVSALLIVDFLPAIMIGLLLGPLVDRYSRRGLMIGSDVARAALFVGLALAPSVHWIVVLAGLAGFATGFFRPAVYAGLPNLVEAGDLPRANSLLQTTESATWAIGPLLSGVLVAATSPDVAYWANAVTFIVSALLVVRIPHEGLQRMTVPSRGHWRDLGDGFELVRRSRPLLAVLVAWSIAMLGNAAVNVAEIVLAKDVFDAGDFGFGVLVAVAGVGLVVGALLASPLLERRPLNMVYAGAFALMGVGVALTAGSPSLWVALPFVLVYGLGNGGANVCNPLLVQIGAPDQLRGRAFTTIMSVNYAVLGIAMAVAGPLTNALGARWVWGVGAISYGVAFMAAAALAPSTRNAGSDVEEAVVSARDQPAMAPAGALPKD
jgi:MFS family permease